MSVGSSDGTRRLVDGLGWFSLGLGSAQLVAPGVMNRLVGADDDAVSRAVQRWLGGAREIAAGVGIELRRRPVRWLWARVAGDVLDLTMLVRCWVVRGVVGGVGVGRWWLRRRWWG
jgi:hypothetical protein